VRREKTQPSVDNYTTLVDLTSSETIRRKGKNRLGIRAIGDHFEFFINEVLAVELTDTTYAAGEVGLFLDHRNKIRFCGMRVMALE
jgi:hypothetical protein